MAGFSGEQSSIAQKTWEMANNIEIVSNVDEIYRYDKKEQQDILAAKPWEKEYVESIKPIITGIYRRVFYMWVISCIKYSSFFSKFLDETCYCKLQL